MSTAFATKPKIVNGVNVSALFETIDAVKGNAEIAKFNFRATNRWMGGDKNRSTIKEFTGALQEHREGVQAFVAEILQSAACHAAHKAEARLARWLLLVQDRAGGAAVLPLTQEFLALMLGVRRTTVTEAARRLQGAGLIGYRRGRVSVLDRAGLEAAACECYGAICRAYERCAPGVGDAGAPGP